MKTRIIEDGGFFYPQHKREKLFNFGTRWMYFLDIDNTQTDPCPCYYETDYTFYLPLKFKTKEDAEHFLEHASLTDYIQ